MSLSAKHKPEQLITDNLDIWSSAIKHKSATGRGSSKKIDLYGIKKLRELILELAVRGLLVPQDPNDEPASVLLGKIATEKERLVKDGKIKKQKKLISISEDEMPFSLPLGWSWARLGDTGLGFTGKTPSTNNTEFFNGDIPFVGPGQITPNGQLLDADKSLSEIGLEQSVEALPGDILMVCIGGSIGKSVISDKRIAFNQQINSLRPIHISSSYLYKAVSTGVFYGSVLEKASGSATPIINRTKWEELLVPVCPEAEQPRIVAKVDELMALCDQLEQQQESIISSHQTLVETLLAALTNAGEKGEFNQAWARIADHFDTLFTTEHSIDQLKQTILQLAVMGKLVAQDPNDEPASVLLEKIATEKAQLVKEGKIKKQKPLPEIGEDEKPFELPVGWGLIRLDDICYGITSGSTPPKDEFREDEGVPYLKVYNIREQRIDFDYKSQYVDASYHSTKLKRSILYPGDVVMNIVGPPLGKVAIIPSTYPEWNCNQAITFFRPIEPEMNTYIYTYLIAGTFLNAIELIGTAGQDNISVTKSRSIVLPIPPLEEQPKIVAIVEKLMALCDSLKARIKESQTTQLHLADAMAEQALN